MAELRGFLVTSGDQVGGLPRVEIDGMYVVVRRSLPDLAEPGLAYEERYVPAEAMYLADQLARASRSLDGAWYVGDERPEYVPHPRKEHDLGP